MTTPASPDIIRTARHVFSVNRRELPYSYRAIWIVQQCDLEARVIEEWAATSRKKAREAIAKLAANQRVLDGRRG